MMKRAVSLAILMGVAPLATAGVSSRTCVVPANPVPFLHIQPNGTSVTLQMRGTPGNNWYEDADGFPVLVDPQDSRRYVYAQTNARGELVPSSYAAGVVNPDSVGIQTAAATAKVASKLQAWNPDSTLHPQLRASSPGLDKEPIHTPQKRALATVGTVKNLVVNIIFSDHGPGGQNRTLPSVADIDTIMNAVGGDPVLAPTGSVRDNYLENSYGLLTIDSTVAAWVTVPNTEAYYANGNSGLTSLTWDLITDALNLVDPAVNFSQFDQDSDGVIDAITFLHSGYGAEWGGTDQYGTPNSDRMWSHRWSIPTWTSAEGVSVSAYHISPGLWGTSGSNIGRIGVIAHETGHFFGLPDLYDTDGSSSGIGNWCLMAAGSWGFDGSQQNPTHMSPWCKMHLGWMEPELITTGSHVLQNVVNNDQVFRIQGGYAPGESLVLEAKKNLGFDAVVPQEGLAIWHIDEPKSGNNNNEGFPGQAGWPGNGEHMRNAILQADGFFELENDIGRGNSGDIYHQGGVDEISPSTTPNTDAYQEGNVAVTDNVITNITNVGNTVTFDYQNINAPRISQGTLPPAAVGTPYSMRLDGLGGTTPHQWIERIASPSYSETDLGSNQYSAVGVAQGWQSDEDVWTLPLPFSFPFYDDAYDTAYVSSNGFIDFYAGGDTDAGNFAPELQFTPRIAPLWDDIRTDSGGDIYVDTSTAGQVTVRWVGEHFNTGNPVAFSATLFDDGRIRFHYGSGNTSLTPTVGIGGGLGAYVDLASYDTASSLTNSNSLEFTLSGSQVPPGLTLSDAGVLTGTPAVPGSYTFEALVRDDNLLLDKETFTLDVLSAMPGSPEMELYPQDVYPNSAFTVRTHGGQVGGGTFGLLFITNVGGTPTFTRVITGPFDANGVWDLPFIMLDYVGFSGITMEFTVITAPPAQFLPARTITLQ